MRAFEYSKLLFWCVQFTLTRLVIAKSNATGTNPSLKNGCGNICLTGRCIDFANDVLNKMDKSVDPCDDFYQFVCGRYPENSFIMNHKHNMYYLQVNPTLALYRRLHDLVNDMDGRGAEVNIAKNVKTIFQSCLNSKSMDREVNSLMSFVLNIIPHWPRIESSVSLSDMQEILVQFSLLGAFSFFDIEIEHMNMDSIKEFYPELAAEFAEAKFETSIKFTPQNSLLVENCTDSICDTNSKIQEVRTYLSDILYYVGIKNQDEILDDVFRIDARYGNLLSSDDWNITKTFCNGNYSTWCALLSRVSEKTHLNLNLSMITIKLEDNMLLSDVDDFLKREPPISILHYLVMRFLYDTMKTLDFYIMKNNDGGEFKEAYGSPEYFDRELRCVLFIGEYLPFILSKEYLRSSGMDQKLKFFVETYEDIQRMTTEIIKASSFSEQYVELFSRAASSSVLTFMQYANYISKIFTLEDRFHTMFLNSTSFATNIVEAKRIVKMDWIQNYLHGLIYLTETHKKLFFYDAMAAENEIVTGFGILEEPNLETTLPAYHRFGSIGTILAHELGHNVFFPEAENKEDSSLLQEFQSCMENVYDNFEIPLIGGRSSTPTYVEDFADFLGITIAYEAYQLHLDEQSKENVIPGLNFTANQMFFITWAQLMCEFGTADGYLHYRQNIHSPNKHRINGPFMNFIKFADSFNCPVNSFMNPRVKCNFWK